MVGVMEGAGGGVSFYRRKSSKSINPRPCRHVQRVAAPPIDTTSQCCIGGITVTTSQETATVSSRWGITARTADRSPC